MLYTTMKVAPEAEVKLGFPQMSGMEIFEKIVSNF